MKLYVEIKDPNLRYQYERYNSHATSSGFDLIFPETFSIYNNEVKKIDFEIVTWTPDGHGYLLVPRSSIGKHQIQQINSVGVIDQDYLGHLKVEIRKYSTTNYHDIYLAFHYWLLYFIFFGLFLDFYYKYMVLTMVFIYANSVLYDKYFGLSRKVTITKGASLFQIISPSLEPINIEIVSELPEEAREKSLRGTGGFGSTNVMNQ